MAPDPIQPDIFSYLDYRQFLRDLTQFLKRQKRFNVRAFAERAGLRSPGYLKMVIDGVRNITIETAERFCRALEIADREKPYFEKLVIYNQTSDPDLKREYFDALMSLRPRSSDFAHEKRLNRYFSQPHFVTIREMATLKDFREDPKWIARRCLPPISPADAREALDTLTQLGLLKRDPNGHLVQADQFISTEKRHTQAVVTYHYHESMLNKARHALGMLPPGSRHYDALTLPLPQEMYGEILQEFTKFRNRVVELANRPNLRYDEVFQLNFQLFPATKQGSAKKSIPTEPVP